MGLILDIVDKVSPKVQKRVEKDGIEIKQAVKEEIQKLGYKSNMKESESDEK